MNQLQKTGCIAALYQAAAYVWGIVFFLFIVNYSAIVEPAEKLAFVMDNRVSMYITHMLMYVVFGAFLVVLVLALHERLKNGAPAMTQVATALGLIWACSVIASGMVYNIGIDTTAVLYKTDPAQATLVWSAIEAVSDALGGGNGEFLGGIWTLLISWAALRSGGLPRGLSYLGMGVGVVGIVSTIPGLRDLAGLFGLSQVVWFVWLGILLLRSKPGTATHETNALVSNHQVSAT
jgi:hypothetical protein